MPTFTLERPTSVPGLDINPVADGYIVYQTDRDRIHYLNATAAIVLEMCNGRNAANELPELLRLAFDLAEPPVDAVVTCLETLANEGLIR